MVTPYLNASSWPKADFVAVVIFGLGGITMFLLMGRKRADRLRERLSHIGRKK
jgi:hypothetical protein